MNVAAQIQIAKSWLVLKHGDGSHDESDHGNRGGGGPKRFSDAEKEILLHRLEGGTIPEVMADSDIMSLEEAEIAVEKVINSLKNNFPIDTIDKTLMAVLTDALDGSTFFAGMDEAIANGTLSRKQASAYNRAARNLERRFKIEIPRN